MARQKEIIGKTIRLRGSPESRQDRLPNQHRDFVYERERKDRQMLSLWIRVPSDVHWSLRCCKGGFGLATEPSGANLGFHVDLLSKSPFSDYLIPGLILLVIIGLGSLAGGVLSILRSRYSDEIAAVSGAFLMIWITAQVCWIELTTWLQPLFFGLGLLELVLGLLLWRRGRWAQAHHI